MTELASWNLTVSRTTDIDVRAFLAERGQTDGDLARFIEELVNRELLRQTMDEAGARNADLSEEEVMKLVNEEIAAVRAERGADWRKWCE